MVFLELYRIFKEILSDMSDMTIYDPLRVRSIIQR